MSCPPALLSTVEEPHKQRKIKKKQSLVQGFIDNKMVNCYCMAICMYVVALVNHISFDEGEEMNKLIDAINHMCHPWALPLFVRPFSSWDLSGGDSLVVCNFHNLKRNRGFFLWNVCRGNILTRSHRCPRRSVPSLHLQTYCPSFPSAEYSKINIDNTVKHCIRAVLSYC